MIIAKNNGEAEESTQDPPCEIFREGDRNKDSSISRKNYWLEEPSSDDSQSTLQKIKNIKQMNPPMYKKLSLTKQWLNVKTLHKYVRHYLAWDILQKNILREEKQGKAENFTNYSTPGEGGKGHQEKDEMETKARNEKNSQNQTGMTYILIDPPFENKPKDKRDSAIELFHILFHM